MNSAENIHNTISYRKIIDVHFIKLFELDLGSHKYYGVSRNDTLFQNKPNAVCIFAKVGRKYLLIREYRPLINDYIIDVPAGLIDGNENPENTARRELMEETGFELKIEEISPALHGSVGLTDESSIYVYGRAKHVGEQSLEQTENIEVLLLTRRQAKRLNGKISAKAWSWINSEYTWYDKILDWIGL